MMKLEIFGAAGEVTGSCYLLSTGNNKILLDCGLFQGSANDERKNRDTFPFDPSTLDAVVLSHCHLDHSGRLPLLVRDGFRGHIFTHTACRELCDIMLADAAYLNEKNVEWENRKRERRGLPLLEPLYTGHDSKICLHHFKTIPYNEACEIVPGVVLQLFDAGHILGSSIVELSMSNTSASKNSVRRIIFSGDLGKYNSPILRDPSFVNTADFLMMESTYGDRDHRSIEETLLEMESIIEQAHKEKGNILIPSFAVGRSQEILYLFAKYYDQWNLKNWHIFLDSPMAIDASQVYFSHKELYDKEASRLWRNVREGNLLPNLHFTRTTNQSMKLNQIKSGAIIIAGSGMCNGGRIRHHLKHNIWKHNTHVVIVGYQARGTPGRALVDGTHYMNFWGETVRVSAVVHTLGGFSAHADQSDLLNWYGHINSRPPVLLVHGEPRSQGCLKEKLEKLTTNEVHIAKYAESINLNQLPKIATLASKSIGGNVA